MRLADYIKSRRRAFTPAPDNTEKMAKQFEAMGEVAPQPSPPNKKILNQNIVKKQEMANRDSPYQGASETVDSESPVESNPMLRDHIRTYKQHAMKQDKNKFDTKGFV